MFWIGFWHGLLFIPVLLIIFWSLAKTFIVEDYDSQIICQTCNWVQPKSILKHRKKYYLLKHWWIEKKCRDKTFTWWKAFFYMFAPNIGAYIMKMTKTRPKDYQ